MTPGEPGSEQSASGDDGLVPALLDGNHRALARVITKIENRSPGYRDLVRELHGHTGEAAVIGVTGSPGAGKSTLVDKLAKAYRDRGLTVGVIAVDPSSPYTGGAVLGDRIRMASTLGDMDVFFRSMSARGKLGGLATATADAVRALDAFGKDRIIVETVGAGQNEVDIVRTADTVAVLVQPGSGDDVQMLKAGILEIGDVFVVNKADTPGTDRTVSELEEMIHLREEPTRPLDTGHHGHGLGDGEETCHGDTAERGRANGQDGEADAGSSETWTPSVVRTVATSGEGIDDLVETFERHRSYLEASGELSARERARFTAEIRQLLRSDAGSLLEAALEQHGGVESLAAAVERRETDPYTVVDEVLAPLADCIEARGAGDRD